MRIAMLSWESLHSIATGGVAVHVTKLAAALRRRGHDVHIITRKHGEQPYYECLEGVHYHRCSYLPHPDFVDDMNNMCQSFVERFAIVEDMYGQFDVVHAHDWLTANGMIWLKQQRGKKGIFTIHSTEYARCGNAFPDGRSQRIRDQERAGCYWADHVIGVSRTTREELQWMYEVPDWKISAIYNGVDYELFNTDIDPEPVRRHYDIGPMDPVILFCGRLEWQKGPDILVEAIPPVIDYYPSAKFLFVGEGRMRPHMEHRAHHLGIEDALRFTGFREGQDLRELFQCSDTVCVPSRNEPFGIVVLEAWSAGKPVIVTNVGGPAEYVEHDLSGLKVTSHPESIAWGLGTLLANFERARWMGENGRTAVKEHFSWDVIAEQTEQVYALPEAELGEAARRQHMAEQSSLKLMTAEDSHAEEEYSQCHNS